MAPSHSSSFTLRDQLRLFSLQVACAWLCAVTKIEMATAVNGLHRLSSSGVKQADATYLIYRAELSGRAHNRCGSGGFRRPLALRSQALRGGSVPFQFPTIVPHSCHQWISGALRGAQHCSPCTQLKQGLWPNNGNNQRQSEDATCDRPRPHMHLHRYISIDINAKGSRNHVTHITHNSFSLITSSGLSPYLAS